MERSREEMKYLLLLIEFFKTGLFAIGGGLATLPFLSQMGEEYGWFSQEELANMLAVSESTPGPIGVNMATDVGFVNGMIHYGIVGPLLGAVTATLGLITPSVIIILIVAAILKSFRNNRYVESAFYGLRPASTGLIAAAGISVVLSNLFYSGQAQLLQAVNWKGWVLAILLWVLTNVVKGTKKLHPIVFIGLAALAGIVFQMG